MCECIYTQYLWLYVCECIYTEYLCLYVCSYLSQVQTCKRTVVLCAPLHLQCCWLNGHSYIFRISQWLVRARAYTHTYIEIHGVYFSIISVNCIIPVCVRRCALRPVHNSPVLDSVWLSHSRNKQWLILTCHLLVHRPGWCITPIVCTYVHSKDHMTHDTCPDITCTGAYVCTVCWKQIH